MCKVISSAFLLITFLDVRIYDGHMNIHQYYDYRKLKENIYSCFMVFKFEL